MANIRTLARGPHRQEVEIPEFQTIASNGRCLSNAAGENWVIVVQYPTTVAELRAECCTCPGMLFYLCLVLAILSVASFEFICIPWIVVAHCHKAPSSEIWNFTLGNLDLFQANPNLTGSPWLVNSSFSATYWAGNRNTVAKCFTSIRELDVTVEQWSWNQTQVILQQRLPLHFSLKPKEGRYFTVELNGTNVQLSGESEAELVTGNIFLLDVYYAVRYLTADRRSKWENNSISCWFVPIRNFTCHRII